VAVKLSPQHPVSLGPCLDPRTTCVTRGYLAKSQSPRQFIQTRRYDADIIASSHTARYRKDRASERPNSLQNGKALPRCHRLLVRRRASWYHTDLTRWTDLYPTNHRLSPQYHWGAREQTIASAPSTTGEHTNKLPPQPPVPLGSSRTNYRLSPQYHWGARE
jgi:hypothetical protein